MPTKLKDVYLITERGEEGKSFWSRIGIAFVNQDNSLNVILDALPLNGKIHIRDRKVANKKNVSSRSERFPDEGKQGSFVSESETKEYKRRTA